MAESESESESENLEVKLSSLLSQVQTEHGIFERLMHKSKNQHRRCSYFHYLLQVRRDMKLLESAKLREILSSCFQVINGKRAKQKVHLLESLKRRKIEVGKFSFLDRLLGVARLLSQMVEPMLKAATEISVVLARTFFMGFSLTVLSLLARIRVLVQQILLDVVSVFNTVSSLSQSKQSVKINEGGLEVFREVFPTKEEFVILECVWKLDKFVLLEKTRKTPIPSYNVDLEEQTSTKASSSVRYLTIESFLGVDETPKEAKENPTNEKSSTNNIEGIDISDSVPGQLVGDSDEKSNRDCQVLQDPSESETPSEKLPQSSLLSPLKSGFVSRKVAFVAVQNPVPTTLANRVKETERKSDGNDSFFSLLAAGSTKESLI